VKQFKQQRSAFNLLAGSYMHTLMVNDWSLTNKHSRSGDVTYQE